MPRTGPQIGRSSAVLIANRLRKMRREKGPQMVYLEEDEVAIVEKRETLLQRLQEHEEFLRRVTAPRYIVSLERVSDKSGRIQIPASVKVEKY